MKIYRKILSYIERKYIYIPGWIAIILFNAAVVPLYTKYGMTINNPPVVPDLRLYYNSADLYEYFDILDAAGRHAYKTFLVYFDIPYLIIYSFIYATTVFILCKEKKYRISLSFIPLGIGIFDFSENLSLIALQGDFPVLPGSLVRMASFFTEMKWLFASVTAILLIYCIISKIKHHD